MPDAATIDFTPEQDDIQFTPEDTSPPPVTLNARRGGTQTQDIPPVPPVAPSSVAPTIMPRYQRTGSSYVAAPNQQTSEERLGNMVPEAATPALSTLNENFVQPYKRYLGAVGKAGGEMAEGAAARVIQPFAAPELAAQPTVSMEEMEKRFPALGVAKGIGETAAATVGDPLNWPFFASATARPLLQMVIGGGFRTMLGVGALQGAKQLHDQWDQLTPTQRYELAAQSGLSAALAAGAQHLRPEFGAYKGTESPESVFRNLVYKAGQTVPEGFTPEQATTAFKAAQRNVHPDVNPSPEAAGLSRDLGAAYQKLHESGFFTPSPTGTPTPGPVARPTTVTAELQANPPTREEIANAQGATNYAGPAQTAEAIVKARQAAAVPVEQPKAPAVPPRGERAGAVSSTTGEIAPASGKIDFTPEEEIKPKAVFPEKKPITQYGFDHSIETGPDIGQKVRAEKPPLPRGGEVAKSEPAVLPKPAGELAAGATPSEAVAKPVAEGEKEFKYRSTQINISPDSEAHTALEAARARIPDADLAGKGKDVGGNHLTVKYGLKAADDNKLEKLKTYISSLAPFEASLGKTEKFEPTEHSDGAAVIQAPVNAPELHEINKELEKHGDFKPSDFGEYKPHSTIAYVAPEKANRYVGMSVTAGKKFMVDSIAVTDRNGKQEEIPLRGAKGGAEVEASKPPSTAIQFEPEKSDREILGGAPKPSETGSMRTDVREGGRAEILQSEIKGLKDQAAELSKQVTANGLYSPEAKPLAEKHTEIRKKILEREDELARVKGEPTRTEKRDLQTKEAEKSFADRPKEALSYTDPKHSQHWQVLEPDFIERRFNDRVRTYERGITESQAELDGAKVGTKKHAEAKMNLEFRKQRLQRLQGRDPREAQSFKTEYLDLVKKAVSQGKPVPEAVIAQKREFETAKDARERYEKGRHTSFANKSAAINDTMQKEEGYKVKRQDGKAITDAQIKEIRESVQDVEKVLGSLKDILSGVDLTIVHTSGTYPFLMNDAAGLYSDADRRITVGLEGAWTSKPYPVLAHEIGHLIDIKGGNLLGRTTRVYTKGGKGYTLSSLAEADDKLGSSGLIQQAKRAINDIRDVRELLTLMDKKSVSELTDEEKTKAEMVKVKLGPYFYEPREIFARLFEQYVANKLGRGGPAAMTPLAYSRIPGYWTQSEFDKLTPLLETEIAKRMNALKEHYAPKAEETGAPTKAAIEPSIVPTAIPPAPAIDKAEGGPRREVISSEKNAPTTGKQDTAAAEIPGPGAKNVSTGNETNTTSIQDLTQAIARQVPERRPLKDRLNLAAAIGEKSEDLKGSVGRAYGRIKGASAALWDAYKRPPRWTEYEDATGKWSGADQVNALDLERFTRAIKEAVPDKVRRDAISNWIEAAGDDATLRDRADRSAAPYKKGYEDALDLTDAEKTIGRNVMNRNDATLAEAQKAGILEHGVENYVRHVYADNPKMQAKVRGEMNFSSLQTKPSFTKQRVLPTYFDAEQAGFTPKDKDVGYLTAIHERSFREALAARAYIRALMGGKALDGRPLVMTSWSSAKELEPRDAESSAAYLVKPNVKAGEEFGDYRPIDHPSLRGWRWAGKTSEGEPIFVQGNALVHPEIFRKLKNNLTKSAIRSYEMEIAGHTFTPGAFVLNASAEIKHAILSFSGFHQTTLSLNAAERRTMPTAMPELDLNDSTQRGLVDHGLMVAQYDAEEQFAEGVASGGIVTKIPGIGPIYGRYIHYLFNSYLPRLKMAASLNALARNLQRYEGKLTEDQIYGLTAAQGNASFGGLNYRMLGRNKTIQDVLRLGLMAPDFFEARARTTAQAVKPFGHEQLMALLGGALVLYTIARVLNEITDKDPHWDKPFGVVYQGKEYGIRPLQQDIFKAVTEPGKYFMARLSPLVATAIHLGEGRNEFGRKQTVGEVIKNAGRQEVPIPLQPWTKESKDTNAQKAVETIAKMVGVNVRSAHEAAEERLRDHEREGRELEKELRDAEKVGDQDTVDSIIQDSQKIRILSEHEVWTDLLKDLHEIDREIKDVKLSRNLSEADRRQYIDSLTEARKELLTRSDEAAKRMTP